MSLRRGRERDDLATLSVAVVVVPLTWWILLGWSWPRVIFGFDDVTLPGLLAIREMVETGAGWSSLVYRPDLLGGVKVANVNGRFPLYPIGAQLGLSTTGIAVLSAFVVHALLGFLGCRAATDLALVWSDGRRRLTLLEGVAVVWLCAFAPALGWRFGVGHPAVVVGLLPFAAALVLVAAAGARTPTLTVVAVSAAACVLGVLHVGQQLVVYGAVFGGPILIGVWISLGRSWRSLALPALVVIGAFLIALPAFWGILAQGWSSDSPRVLGVTSVTYTFLTATASDWLASLPWMRPAVPAGLRAEFAHEVNYPVGPLLLLLALVPWRRARAVGVGLVVSLVGILVFSLDLAPWSRALLTAVPPLHSFRVPARSVLPWLWTLPILATAALVSRPSAAWPGWAMWLAIPASALLFVAPSLGREVGAVLLVIVVVVLTRQRRWPVPAAVVLVVLGVASAAAFRDRLLPLLNAQELFATADGIGMAVRTAKPELDSALARVRLEFQVPAFTANSAFAAKLSSLDGYAVPTRRFSALVSALRGDRYEPTANFFWLPPADPAFPVLRQLYNVTDSVTLVPPRRLAITPLGATAGPAWFSASVARVDDLGALARELRAAGDTLHLRVREALWGSDADPLAAGARLPTTIDARCRDARVVAVLAPRHGGAIVTTVATAAACPLTIATNFTEDLRATATLEGGRRVGVPVFPAYGALAGVLVPAGTTAISLDAEPVRLSWAPAWMALGIACCGAAAWLARRRPSC